MHGLWVQLGLEHTGAAMRHGRRYHHRLQQPGQPEHQWRTQANHFSVWSGIDSLSYTHGNHLFKFGGEIHDTLFSGSKSLTNDNGTFDFGKTAAFTAGASTLAL